MGTRQSQPLGHKAGWRETEGRLVGETAKRGPQSTSCREKGAARTLQRASFHKTTRVAVSCARTMCTFHLHQDSGKAGHPLDARPHGGRRGPCHQSKKSMGDDHRAIDVGPEPRTWPGQRPRGEARLVHGFCTSFAITASVQRRRSRLEYKPQGLGSSVAVQ